MKIPPSEQIPSTHQKRVENESDIFASVSAEGADQTHRIGLIGHVRIVPHPQRGEDFCRQVALRRTRGLFLFSCLSPLLLFPFHCEVILNQPPASFLTDGFSLFRLLSGCSLALPFVY